MSVMGPNEKMLVRSNSTQSLKTEVERLKQEEKDQKERERKERLERLREEYNFRMGTSVMDRTDYGVKRPNPKSFPSHYASPRLVRKPKGQGQVNGSLSPPPAPRMLADAAKVNSEPGVLHSMPTSAARKLNRSVSESKPLAVPNKKSQLSSPTRSPSSTSSSPAPPRRTRASTHSEVETDLRRMALERGKGANANAEPRPRVNSMPTQNRVAKQKGNKTGSLDNLKKSPRGSQASLASSKTNSTRGSKDSVSSAEENMAKLSLSSEGVADFPPGIVVDGDQVFFADGDVDHTAGGDASDAHPKHEKRVKKSPIPSQYKGYEVDYQGQFDNVVQSNFNEMLGIHTILSMVNKQQ
ncbi:PREDICTED: microtubule-associated protein 4-like [Branchiostoma belcheri]|uniref:Microtubule-associated protein 4-like n=1 Tax=Branchiostoma belcheri TaxID=7741 RepID=A0A6P5AAY0_BRABE|nr:PREDICTED: microtubule-associated protein 4-like [Branchiostoma belcheri]